MISIDLQKLKNAGAPKEVVEVYEYFKLYAEAQERKKWQKRQEENWDAIENDFWSAKEKEEFKRDRQVVLNINELVKGVQSICAVVTAERPEYKCHPRGENDLYVAELLQRGLDTVWIKSEGGQVIYHWNEEREIGGLGWLNVSFDPDKGPFGRIQFDDEDPTCVFVDPKSRKQDYSDSHIIKARTRTKQYIKDTYGDEISDEDLYWEKATIEEITEESHSQGLTSGDNYTLDEGPPDSAPSDSVRERQDIWEVEALLLKKREETWVIFRGPDGSPQTAQVEPGEGEDEEEAAKRAVPEGAEFISTWKRRREIREHRLIVGKKMVEKTEDPYGVDADGNPVINLVPLAAQRSRSAYPISPTTYARDLNKAFCKALIQFLNHLSHNVNSPIIEADNAVRWEGQPGAPGSRARVDLQKAGGNIQNALSRLQPGAFQAAHFLELREGIRGDINSAFDSHEVMRGKIPEGTDPSGRTVLALQDMAGMMNQPRLRSLESALVQMAKCIISLMLKHWTRSQWERLIEPDEMKSWIPPEERPRMMQQQGGQQQGGPMGGQPMMGGPQVGNRPQLTPEQQAGVQEKWMAALEKLRPMDHTQDPQVDVVDLDIKITSGSSMPTNRIAKLDFALQMADAGVYDRLAVLEYVDDPKAEEIDARMRQQEQQAMMAEAMGKGS